MLIRPIFDDRQQKTIIRIAAAPIQYKEYLTQHLFAYLTILSVQNIIMIIILSIYHQLSIQYLISILALYIAYSFMALAFTLCYTSFFRNYVTSMAIFSGLSSLMALLTGLMIPLSMLSERLIRVTQVIPTYWLAYGLDELAEKNYFSIPLSISILIIYGIIFILIGSKRRF